MKLILGIVIFNGGTLICPGIPHAVEITPFYTKNLSPIIQIYGLPTIGEANILSYGKGKTNLKIELSSNYTKDLNSREQIILDGERAQITFSGRYGIGNKMEIGLEIPFINNGGGFLDSFIENYHTTCGFPNGGRDVAPQKRLVYKYEKNGKTILYMSKSGTGIGDISLVSGWELYKTDRNPVRGLTLRMSLKIPTGNSNTLQGSGSTDIALWVVGSEHYKIYTGHLTIYEAVGIMAMTQGDVLQDQQRPFVGFGTLGTGWSPLDWLAFKIQTNVHTSFYRDSNFKQVNSNSAQLIIGGTLAFSQQTSLDIGIMEDIVVKASPDVVFHLSLSQRF